MSEISYRKIDKRWKYQLTESYGLIIGILPPDDIMTEFITLFTDGNIIIKRYYAWDGATFPAWDTANFMRASLVHDALYQLMRERQLDIAWRNHADQILRAICLEEGMNRFRANYVYWAVKHFAKNCAEPKK